MSHNPTPCDIRPETLAALRQSIERAQPDAHTNAAFVRVDTRVLVGMIETLASPLSEGLNQLLDIDQARQDRGDEPTTEDELMAHDVIAKIMSTQRRRA
jgi:hypothetical protein